MAASIQNINNIINFTMNSKTFYLLYFAMSITIGTYAQKTYRITIPQQGNTYVTSCNGNNPAVEASKIIDTQNGKIINWNDSKTVISLYFKTSRPGTFRLCVKATAGKNDDTSTLRFSSDKQKYTVTINGGDEKDYMIGLFRTNKSGYNKIDIKGLKRTGNIFGNISEFTVEGDIVEGDNNFIPKEKLQDCYWFRRGPSVHMNYKMPDSDIEYFYNEAVIPKGYDINGTYFMLTGFREGYMGIQSIKDKNGKNANKILFSVWSPYTTDNPNEIPDSLHVKIISQGQNVTAQNFGNEGSGKQSFMHYPWRTGKTYKTLVKIEPDNHGNTIYTGFFGDEKGNWHLLSKMLRPATHTYYKGAHSFLECFIPETSINTRSVIFKNPWVRDRNGIWHEITEATFTCDGTGLSKVRTDMEGTVNDNTFILKNCGFTDKTTQYGTKLTRRSSNRTPQIDIDAIERLAR